MDDEFVSGPVQNPVGDAELHIRPALVEDSNAIADFQTRCWRAAYTGMVPQAYLDRVGTAQRERRWRKRLLARTRAVALAEDEGRVVGVVSWAVRQIADAPPLELTSLYVAPSHQGTGLGGRLLHHAVHDSTAHLWVFEANLSARKFYRKHGFLPDGRRTTDADTGLLELLYVRR